MRTNFSIGTFRSLHGGEAGYSVYPSPTLHPQRLSPDFHDFVLNLEGGWRINLCDEELEIFPGDVFILPAGYPYYSREKCKANTGDHFFHLNPEMGDGADREDLSDDGISRLTLPSVVHCQNNRMVSELFSEIVHISNSNDPNRDAVLSGIIQTLIFYLHRADNSVIIDQSDLVDSCLRLMRDTPNMIFKETDMAEMLYVSVKTLRGSFKKRFNKTFYQYQLDDKLRQAYSLLRTSPSIRLYEISDELGFCDEFHLSKLFKKKYGISPSQLQRKMFESDK